MPILDSYFLSFTLIVTFVQQMIGFIIAATCKFDTITDLFYGTNFFILAITTLFINGTYFVRQVVLASMVMIWGVRLSLFLFYRILRTGTDKRFDEWRDKPLLLFRFWFLQFLAVWVIFIPVAFVMADTVDSPLLASDWIEMIQEIKEGGVMKDRGNGGASLYFYLAPIRSHPTFRSRHPNYFGEITIWFGIWISCASTFVATGEPVKFLSIISPVFITSSILFLSGITRLEESADKRYGYREDYRLYKARTSVLVPLPPACFGSCPQGLKCCLCCEWPLYDYIDESEA